MVLEFNTSLAAGNTVTLPLYGSVNVIVNWGDGSSESFTTLGDKNHTFQADGIYTVNITGILTQFGKWNIGYANAEKLVKVTSFGTLGLTSLNGAFLNAINLIQVPSQIPNTVTDITQMFGGATSFNFDIGNWNVSNVNSMYGIFDSASSFNQDISGWNVSNVSDMHLMFNKASSFNHDISGWDVSNVIDMSQMFSYASSFNQNIGIWVVSKVANMDSMFNQATSFNANIGAWNVAKVTGMSAMFAGATFFNQDIGAWNVFKVTDMTLMFAEATSFNQNIGAWDTKKVTDMSKMFYNASSFNQDLGGWTVTKATAMVDMFYGVKLSTTFYNNLLIGWVSQIVNSNVIFNAGNSKYSLGAPSDARAVLTSTYQWTIIDGGVSDQIVITTQEPTDIGITSATSGGNITDDVGSTIIARGVVWHTVAYPTISVNTGITDDGTGTGIYSSSLTSLIPGNTYYIRAYATNGLGTEYGNSFQFIAQQELTITGSFTANNKEYDSKVSASMGTNNLSLSGILGGHPNVTLANVVLTFDNANVGNAKIVSILSAALIGADAYKYKLSLVGSPTTIANITSKELIVEYAVASNKVYDASLNTVITNANLVGIVPGDDVAINSTSGTFDDKNVGIGKTVSSLITIDGADAINYTLIQPLGLSADISPIELTVLNAVASNKIYDGLTTTAITGSTLQGVFLGDVVTFDSQIGFFDNKNVGTDKIVTATLTIDGADAINYTLIQPLGLSADISPAELTVLNAEASNKVYDKNTNAVITGANLEGIALVDDVSIDNSVGIFSDKNVEQNKGVTSAITIIGNDATNYKLIQPTGLTATITPVALTVINAVASNKVYDGTTIATITGASLEGVLSGDVVTLDVKTGTFDDKNIGIGRIVTGTFTIKGIDAKNYNLSQPTNLSANISAMELKVNGASAATKVYDGTTDVVISGATLVGVASGDDVTLDKVTGFFIDKNVETNKSIITNITITGNDVENYTLTQPTGLRASITTKTLTINDVIALNKVYDGTTLATITGATLVGVVLGDSVVINTQTGNFSNKRIGFSKNINSVLTIKGADALNYKVNQPILTADITAKELTIINAVASDKEYDGRLYTEIIGASLVGVVSGDQVALNNQLGKFNTVDIGKGKTVTAAITIGGDDATNYTLTQPTGLVADISRATLTIVGNFTVFNKVYDGTLDAIINANNLALHGIVDRESVTLINPTAEFLQTERAENIVVYIKSAELTGGDTANYTLSFENSPTTTAAITYAVGINNANNNNLSVYPNPFNDIISIKGDLTISKITLSSVAGQKLLERDTNFQENLKTSNLKQGVYFLNIELVNGKQQVIKLVKQ
jgi:surface protein